VSWSHTLRVRQSLRAKLELGEEIALLFSDIRGFSAYTAQKGDRAAFRLAQVHEGILRECITEFGILVKSLGDGVMAAFESPDLALQAAVSIQQAIRERNLENPSEPIDIGIGVASGTPVMTDIDFIGHAVNLAQRLSAQAKSGQILVTDRIAETTALPEHWQYIGAGERELRGIGRQALLEVVWLREIARVSDALDQITLVITDAGTLVVELARDSKQDIRNALDQLQQARKEEDGAFSAMLQRSIARFTKRVIGTSSTRTSVAREQTLADIDFALRGSNLELDTPDGSFRLTGVDPNAAKLFIEASERKRLEMGESDTS